MNAIKLRRLGPFASCLSGLLAFCVPASAQVRLSSVRAPISASPFAVLSVAPSPSALTSTPVPSATPYLRAAAAVPETLHPSAAMPASETRLSIRSDAGTPVGVFELGATLDRPAGAKAIVVFVQGSGTSDRDETVGPIKPFRDIAQALSRRGIASLRYDKRGFDPASRAAANVPQLSPDHYIADLVNISRRAAAEGLPLFILGHSEGVTYVNEAVARGLVDPRGVILLAGLGRYSLDETLFRQFREGIGAIDSALADPSLSAEQRARLQATKAQTEKDLKDGLDFIARLKSGQVRDDERYFGAYARFWRDEISMTANAAARAADVDKPSLLIQGDADVNVTRDDFNALAAALAPAGGASVWLSGLDHLFVRSGQTAVEPIVPETIADWLDAQLAPLHGSSRTAPTAPTIMKSLESAPPSSLFR